MSNRTYLEAPAGLPEWAYLENVPQYLFDWTHLKDHPQYQLYKKALNVLTTLKGDTPNAIIKYLHWIEITCAHIQKQRSHSLPKEGVLDIFEEGKAILRPSPEGRKASFWTS